MNLSPNIGTLRVHARRRPAGPRPSRRAARHSTVRSASTVVVGVVDDALVRRDLPSRCCPPRRTTLALRPPCPARARPRGGSARSSAEISSPGSSAASRRPTRCRRPPERCRRRSASARTPSGEQRAVERRAREAASHAQIERSWPGCRGYVHRCAGQAPERLQRAPTPSRPARSCSPRPSGRKTSGGMTSAISDLPGQRAQRVERALAAAVEAYARAAGWRPGRTSRPTSAVNSADSSTKTPSTMNPLALPVSL